MPEQEFTVPFLADVSSFYGYISSPPDPQTPSAKDVILGRGGKKHEHSGNVRLHEMALEMISQYMTARKHEKRQLTEQLVRQVHQYGGRFMAQAVDNGPWEVENFEKAKAKARDCLHGIIMSRTPKKLMRERLCNPIVDLEDAADGSWTHVDEGMGGDTDMEFPDFEEILEL
ncbi:expressed unknown protein [Seminavis robusta]|uniref:DUF6824 domain-containing protein n=1 Tax=Seminavis robusta TaxID=568900 RepID=A0A9N8ENJ9_9STRA|nr:expressed unknown protein [Seminavis robusta]|eukprot:Sro1287_g259510.1 n/a (172) ;mRNA; r:28650-29165